MAESQALNYATEKPSVLDEHRRKLPLRLLVLALVILAGATGAFTLLVGSVHYILSWSLFGAWWLAGYTIMIAIDLLLIIAMLWTRDQLAKIGGR